MRNFLSALPIGSLLRPSSTGALLAGRSIVETTMISRLPRYALASTSAQPSSQSPDAFAAEDGPASPIPSDSPEELRRKAIKLYKELHRLGRDYPDPNYEFNKRLRRAYEKNAKTTDPAALQKQLELAEHIKKEVLALISLKKFRHLRRTYHANEGPR